MRKGIFNITAVIFLLIGCSSQNVLKLNDTIVKANDELRIGSEGFNKQFESVTNNNYTVLEPQIIKMISLIDQKVKDVAAIKADMPEGEEFKNAFIDYYKFEKDIYETDFKRICLLTGEGDTDKLSEITLQLSTKAKKEEAMEKNIHAEQERFAKKNNIKLSY